jgi:ribosome maturation factor RimP
MSALERVSLLVEPIVAGEGLDLYDLELNGGVLRVLVDQADGVGLEAITRLTRALSRALDDADPIDGKFTLEVSSPGLERPLRTPAHFEGAVGSVIAVKTAAGSAGDRRVRGLLDSVDADGVVVIVGTDPDERRHVEFTEIERARTVFEWGPGPKPGAPKNPRAKKSQAKKSPAKKAAAKASKSSSSSTVDAAPSGDEPTADPKQDPRKKVTAS